MMRVWVRRHRDLSRTRNRIVCRLHAILCDLVAGGFAKQIGHVPTELAALKCLYLVTRSLDPTGRGRARWAVRTKPALNAFAITFEGRILPSQGN